MKKLLYTLGVILLSFSLSAQTTITDDGVSETHISGVKAPKGKKVENRSATCTGFIYEQDIALNNFTGTGYSPSHVPGQAWYLFDDFPIASTSTINTVVLTAADFKETCTSPNFVINFRSNGINGNYGEILHTRTVAPGAAGYTKECIIPTWQAQFYFMFNIHIPIDPVTLDPGTYWLEIYSPNQPNFTVGIFWQTITPVQGSKARREYLGQNYNFQNRDFAFALSGSTDMPTSYCVPAIEAVCQNASVTLGQNGQAMLGANAVDGGSSGFTNINVSPSIFNCTNLGPNTVTLTVDDGNGNSDDCTATVTVQDGVGLPNSWEGTNIGNVTAGNSYGFEACNMTGAQFSITGSGNNANGFMSDNVAFGSQTLCGDGSITAKIESVDPNGYGGLMIRESTAAGSKQVSIFSNLSPSLRYESRTMTNGPKMVQSFFKPSPTWLRIRRQGMWVHVEYSQNGMMFLPVQSTMVSMQSCVEIGLASFTYQPFGQTTAVFSNVSTTGNIQGLTSGGTATLGAASPVTPVNLYASKPLNLSVFPNPTNAEFTLSLDNPLEQDATVEIINLYGQVIAREVLAAGTLRQEWQTMDWASGTYMLRIQQANEVPLVKQFIVTK